MRHGDSDKKAGVIQATAALSTKITEQLDRMHSGRKKKQQRLIGSPLERKNTKTVSELENYETFAAKILPQLLIVMYGSHVHILRRQVAIN